MPIDYALSNSFGFGGTNAALLFKRYEGVTTTTTTTITKCTTISCDLVAVVSFVVERR